MSMEGPASLRWLLNPADASSRPPKFQAEYPARPGILMGGVPKHTSSSDLSGLDTDFRQPLRTHDDNSRLNEIPTNLNGSIYPQSVSQSNKQRFDAIDDRDCQLSGISAEQPKPKFYQNMTAMRAPPHPKLQQCHYTLVYDTPLQPKGRNPVPSPSQVLQCPYTNCPRTFQTFIQYDEMKPHYAQHANQKAESEIRRGHSYPIELENVNGSCFSFAPKRYTPEQGDWPPKPAKNPNPSAKSTHNTKRRRPSSEPHTLPSPFHISSRSVEPVARTVYDVPHPSRAPLPKAAKTSSPSETLGPGRTIYDVQHPSARRSQRLVGKKGGDSLKGR